jgi:hypothetical protein
MIGNGDLQSHQLERRTPQSFGLAQSQFEHSTQPKSVSIARSEYRGGHRVRRVVEEPIRPLLPASTTGSGCRAGEDPAYSPARFRQLELHLADAMTTGGPVFIGMIWQHSDYGLNCLQSNR